MRASTPFLISGVIFLASKVWISSFTPLLAKKLRCKKLINIIKVMLMPVNILHKEISPRTNQIIAHVPLHADPGGIKDSHQPEHPLQDVPDGVWWGPERADFGQWFRFDVAHGRLCCLHQRLYLRELSVDGLFPGLQDFVFLCRLSLQFLHLVLLVTGILQGIKFFAMLLMTNTINFNIYFISNIIDEKCYQIISFWQCKARNIEDKMLWEILWFEELLPFICCGRKQCIPACWS